MEEDQVILAKPPKKPKIEKRKYVKKDKHIGCYSYPFCDEAPLGCWYFTDNPEPYGFRD